MTFIVGADTLMIQLGGVHYLLYTRDLTVTRDRSSGSYNALGSRVTSRHLLNKGLKIQAKINVQDNCVLFGRPDAVVNIGAQDLLLFVESGTITVTSSLKMGPSNGAFKVPINGSVDIVSDVELAIPDDHTDLLKIKAASDALENGTVVDTIIGSNAPFGVGTIAGVNFKSFVNKFEQQIQGDEIQKIALATEARGIRCSSEGANYAVPQNASGEFNFFHRILLETNVKIPFVIQTNRNAIAAKKGIEYTGDMLLTKVQLNIQNDEITTIDIEAESTGTYTVAFNPGT